MIESVRAAVALPLFVIIRPRGGDFVYSRDELAVMKRDLSAVQQRGADGVVIGFLTPAGDIDAALTREFVAAARELSVTFHRAFDLVGDLEEALDTLVQCGVSRVLTSGGARTALDGADRLASLVAHAPDSLVVMAGGSINESNVSEVVHRSGVREIHARASRLAKSRASASSAHVTLRKPFPSDEREWDETDEVRFRAIVERAAV